MKTIYYGISSKYIHTMPAGWFLGEYLHYKGIEIEENYHNVNEPYEKVLNEILGKDFDNLLLSVYIFNVIFIKKLIKDIKIQKKCTIIVGGPEVNEDFPADHIILGEGEEALFQILSGKTDDKVIKLPNIKNLDIVPSPYTKERLLASENRIIYYESSRGCPFHCTYCMGGQYGNVRYFSLERVKKDLKNIVESGAKIIKFTDRTFNVTVERMNDIFEFILDNFAASGACFHFEVGGDLFKQSTFDILKKMPVGLVQMEAGVQTLNSKSLKAINRIFAKETFINNIKEIISYGNIHMHLDLIAGLPYDDLVSFKESFNFVYDLRPNMFQLGFLKILNNTPIKETYDAVYWDYAPYEVVETPYMKKEDFSILKRIEWAIDRLYNTRKFSYTLEYLLKEYTSAYDLFFAISEHFQRNGLDRHVQEFEIYRSMLSFMGEDKKARDLLRFDYLLTNNSRKYPIELRTVHSKNFNKFIKTIIPDKDYLYEEFYYLPFEKLEGNFIVKFCYEKRNPINNRYNYEIINFSR